MFFAKSANFSFLVVLLDFLGEPTGCPLLSMRWLRNFDRRSKCHLLWRPLRALFGQLENANIVRDISVSCGGDCSSISGRHFCMKLWGFRVEIKMSFGQSVGSFGCKCAQNKRLAEKSPNSKSKWQKPLLSFSSSFCPRFWDNLKEYFAYLKTVKRPETSTTDRVAKSYVKSRLYSSIIRILNSFSLLWQPWHRNILPRVQPLGSVIFSMPWIRPRPFYLPSSKKLFFVFPREWSLR